MNPYTRKVRRPGTYARAYSSMPRIQIVLLVRTFPFFCGGEGNASCTVAPLLIRRPVGGFPVALLAR